MDPLVCLAEKLFFFFHNSLASTLDILQTKIIGLCQLPSE